MTESKYIRNPYSCGAHGCVFGHAGIGLGTCRCTAVFRDHRRSKMTPEEKNAWERRYVYAIKWWKMHAEGREPCHMCYGTGRVARSTVCTFCRGRGSLDQKSSRASTVDLLHDMRGGYKDDDDYGAVFSPLRF